MRISKNRLREIICEELQLVLEATDRAPVVFKTDAEDRRSKKVLDMARQATLAGVPKKVVEDLLDSERADISVADDLSKAMKNADSGTKSRAVSMLENTKGESDADQA
jgi:hypothetical protein